MKPMRERWKGQKHTSKSQATRTTIENGGLLKKFTLLLYRFALKKANCIFFQNVSNCNLFTKEKIAQTKVRVIPGSGVNLSAHKLEEYPSEDGELRFLFIGRVMKDKGIDELLKAAEIVKVNHPQVCFDIIGGCDEDYHERLYAAEQMGFIHYLGLQSDVHDFIKETSISLMIWPGWV